MIVGSMLPIQSFAQKESNDSVENHKEVANRNVLLNASDADKPRQLNIGLPSLSAPVFEDGLPVSYNVWPDMPYASWLTGTSYSKISMASLSETTLQYGAVGYAINSFHHRSGQKTSGTVNYQLNQFGRQVADMTLLGPIAGGFGFMVSTHQIWDPGSSHMQAARLNTRMQNYKFSIDKTFADGRGYMSLLYQYARQTSTSSSYAPFIFVGDGSVKKYNGFNYGTDSYYGNEASSFYYLDVMTGEEKQIDWKDAGTTDNHQLTFNFDYDFTNRLHLNVASKFKSGDVSMGMSAVSGIVDNNGGYYYADGSVFKGDHIQNRWMMYVPGFERDWLTTAVLTGKTRNYRHSWRIAANIWWNRAGVRQMNTIMAHEVKKDPAQLYVKNGERLVPYMAFNPGSGEYYDGHEVKTAVYASDDWTVNKNIWMSAGVRLEYLGYGGKAALNLPAGEKYNSRTPGWSLKSPGAKINRFKEDWINPSLTYNVRYKIFQGFGLEAEYVYSRSHPNLQDYAGSELPITDPVNMNMARGGVYWNTSWMRLVSQVNFITQTNYKSRANFYNTTAAGKEESITIPITNNVQTLGWTTDVVLTPFKGANFHALLTIQDPKYKKFHILGSFPSGAKVDVDLNDNTVTAMSKVLVELDPSYAWNKWRVWLSFRYFSKQYINKTNTLYFNGHWESFGGINYMFSKKINFALNVVNIFNQSGATGSIGAADLVTDTSKYKNYLMSGSYIRPFEISLSTTINF